MTSSNSSQLIMGSSWDNSPIIAGGVSEATYLGETSNTTPTENSLFLNDIAQSRHFTVTLSGFESFQTPMNKSHNFLPVKSINFVTTTYDNLSLPFMIFGNFPILQRKSIGTIQIMCYDTDDDKIEKALNAWQRSCFPKSKYVAYLSEITRTFTYTSYGVDGRENYTLTLGVIPAGSVNISRGYEENGEKLLTFGLAVVGEPGASANSGAGSINDPSKTSTSQSSSKGGTNNISLTGAKEGKTYNGVTNGVQYSNATGEGLVKLRANYDVRL